MEIDFTKNVLATGSVTSPNYPNNYPNNLEKTETIQAKKGLILLLKFTAFDIAESHSTCRYDHLTVTDGDGTILMEKSCGSSSAGNRVMGGQNMTFDLPTVIESTSNIVELYFRTDGSGTRSGWSVSWSAVTPGECQHNVLDNFLFLCKKFHFFQLLKTGTSYIIQKPMTHTIRL